MRKFWFLDPTTEIASDLLTKYPTHQRNFISFGKKYKGSSTNIKLFDIDHELPFAEANTNIQYRFLNVQGKLNNKLEGFTKVTVANSSNKFRVYSTYSTDKYEHDPSSWDILPDCRSTLQTNFYVGKFNAHIGLGLQFDNAITIFTGIKNKFGSLFVQSEMSDTDTKFNVGFHTQIGVFAASKLAVDNNHLRELSLGYCSKTNWYKAFCLIDVFAAQGTASSIFRISKNLKLAGKISLGKDQKPNAHICSVYKRDGAKLRTTITTQELLMDVKIQPKDWLGVNISTCASFVSKVQPVQFGWSLLFSV